MKTNTVQLIEAVKRMYPVVMFFKNRYFPDGIPFHSDEVLLECKKGNRKIAPFVVPYQNGIPVPSGKYSGYKMSPPYIAPSSVITVKDLRDKAFGEDPNSGRSAASRQNELQAERMDDLRQSILRRMEQMCTEIITTGKCVMKHYANAKDFGTNNYKLMELQFYENEFENKYSLTKLWSLMTVKEKLLLFYNMARELKRRGVRATDVVLGAKVSDDLFSDLDFLEYFNKRVVDYGTVNPQEMPEGVTFNGSINITGIRMNFFSYDEQYEDLDGNIKEFIPSGTIAMLEPGMGKTAYGAVDYVDRDGNVQSYAEMIVPKVTADDINNTITVTEASRPLPYPLNFDGWLVADINEPISSQSLDDEESIAGLSLDDAGDGITDEDEFRMIGNFLTADEINHMTRKADLINYANGIGLEGLTDSMSLAELKEAVINYQDGLEADEEGGAVEQKAID